jgi:hypothetical protein
MNNATKRILASSLETPSDMLEVLSTDPDDATRLRVALNPNTPTSVINKMLAHSMEQDDGSGPLGVMRVAFTVPDGEVVVDPPTE